MATYPTTKRRKRVEIPFHISYKDGKEDGLYARYKGYKVEIGRTDDHYTAYIFDEKTMRLIDVYNSKSKSTLKQKVKDFYEKRGIS